MTYSDWLLTAMLLCFMVGWPFSISRMLRVKTAAGKAPIFLVLVILGYVFGVSSRIIVQKYDFFFVVNIVNLVTVSIDLYLVLYYTYWYKSKTNSIPEQNNKIVNIGLESS
jgi:hypothetical protein